MDLLVEYGVFLLQVVTVLVAALIVIRAIARSRGRDPREGHLEVRKLNDGLRRLADAVRRETLDRKVFRQLDKARRKADKATARSGARRPHVFVLSFEGDLRATAVNGLRREVTAVCAAAEAGDEVVLRLSSSGGVVHGYGLAAAQLERLRAQELRLVIAVDKVAASGGYMMACVADRILAAPFAILGSIGVVATMPNFHRALKKRDVDVELVTAGEHKRTLTLFGENTDEGRQKFREQMEEVHGLFKDWVARYRPSLDVAAIATGEHWYGSRALELGLVDELTTSDAYLLGRAEEAELVSVRWQARQRLGERLTGLIRSAAREATDASREAAWESRFSSI